LEHVVLWLNGFDPYSMDGQMNEAELKDSVINAIFRKIFTKKVSL
jgi:hypothetical protein